MIKGETIQGFPLQHPTREGREQTTTPTLCAQKPSPRSEVQVGLGQGGWFSGGREWKILAACSGTWVMAVTYGGKAGPATYL